MSHCVELTWCGQSPCPLHRPPQPPVESALSVHLTCEMVSYVCVCVCVCVCLCVCESLSLCVCVCMCACVCLPDCLLVCLSALLCSALLCSFPSTPSTPVGSPHALS